MQTYVILGGDVAYTDVPRGYHHDKYLNIRHLANSQLIKCIPYTSPPAPHGHALGE
jgi:hypothetical protein